jgi:hypothetical protein
MMAFGRSPPVSSKPATNAIGGHVGAFRRAVSIAA